MSRLLLVALVCAAAGSAAAQGLPGPAGAPSPNALLGAANSQMPPTKKLPNGYCIVPGTPHYKEIKDFIPFVKPEDCVKSGGKLLPVKR